MERADVHSLLGMQSFLSKLPQVPGNLSNKHFLILCNPYTAKYKLQKPCFFGCSTIVQVLLLCLETSRVSLCLASFETDHRLNQTSTTPPQTRKRKATAVLEASLPTKKPTIAAVRTVETPASVAIHTPPPTTMDSDDEFMSGLSSQDEDFGTVEESDDGSLGDGIMLHKIISCRL